MSQHDHNGHRLRMKARFLKEKSFENFEPHNILEFLLFFTIPRKDTNELAHSILNHFGSLHAVFDAPYNELLKIKGVGPNTASLIKAIIPMARAYYTDKGKAKIVLDTTNKIVDYLKGRYIGYTEEVLTIISMDNTCRVISFDVVYKGSINTVSADTRRILEILIRTGATTAIIAHNHPGGFALPSPADATATRNIAFACSSIGVRLTDHIIIANDGCVSLKESKDYNYIFDMKGYI